MRDILLDNFGPRQVSDPRRNGHAYAPVDDAEEFRPRVLGRCMADVESTDVRWTWPNKIPRGRLTVLAGDGGIGKSFLSMAIASIVSLGCRWPDGEQNSAPGTVVLLNAEDDPADTLRRRLDNCAADCRMIHTIEAVERSRAGDPGFFSLADDVSLLERKIVDVNAQLCVVDPLGAYLAGVDSHRDSDLRSVLGPLAAMAQRTDCAILAIAHLNKGSGSNTAAHRVSGSLALSNAARMAWLVAVDPENEQRRLMLPYKANIVEQPTGIAFEIINGAVQWHTGAVTVSADSVLAASAEDRTERDAAQQFLLEILARGETPVREIKQAAESEGHAWRTLCRAKKSLGIKSSRSGFGKNGAFVWALKEVAPNGK